MCATSGSFELDRLLPYGKFRDEVHGYAFLRFFGRILDSSSMGWPTLLGIAIVHCDYAVLLPDHELHLSEE